ncbi:hypothetical protein QAD02_014328 [Eretmocerus hayati]|uniref:Uncharacterized protein n=1 Tax=Eretmocerus hayati TaxID=131215 RepID=A0ACC2P688_9HYME|nr:hypothetical protein QAD02_014328 [Eretmocerus hayati]
MVDTRTTLAIVKILTDDTAVAAEGPGAGVTVAGNVGPVSREVASCGNVLNDAAVRDATSGEAVSVNEAAPVDPTLRAAAFGVAAPADACVDATADHRATCVGDSCDTINEII